MASGKLPSERVYELALERAKRTGLPYATPSLDDILQMLDERLGREMTREDITGEAKPP